MGSWSIVPNELTAPTPGGEPEAPRSAEPVYADFFPKNCPPAGVVHGPMLVFRLVAASAVSSADFVLPHEAGLYVAADQCRRCSLSVFAHRDDAERLRRTAKFFRQHQIAQGIIPPDAGALKHTPNTKNPGHWSWWPASNVVRADYFVLV